MLVESFALYKAVAPVISLVRMTCRFVKFAIERATRWLFMPLYCRSHEIWQEDNRPLSDWDECGYYLEYAAYLPNLTSGDRTPRIALRAKSEEIASLVLVFEADSNRGYFPETITAFDVGQRQKIYSMPNIPCQDYWHSDEGKFGTFAFDSYTIYVKEMTLKSGEKIKPYSSLSSSLMQGWLLQSTWFCKTERYLNLDAIVWAKQRIAEYWKFRFGTPKVIRFVPYPVRRRITVAGMIEFVTRPFAWIMSRKLVVSMQFWSAIWSGFFILNDQSELEFRWKHLVTDKIRALDA